MQINKSIYKFFKKFTPQTLKKIYYSFMKRRKRNLLRFEIHLADHCNLNCIGCGHFSPIAEARFLDVNTFERDCIRLSDLTKRKIELIDLMGGEPLLHPELIKILQIGRRYFDGPIRIITNGILLLKQSPEFWESCKNNHIDIIISQYPVKLNYDEIKRLGEKYGIIIIYRGNGEGGNRVWRKFSLDISGKQNKIKNFRICASANTCTFLDDGKLATCCAPFLIRHFNKYFGQEIHTSENDYIDIYKAKNINEIFDFLRKPIPFCRYCSIRGGGGGKIK
jgi:MoaA/NifB/PqqE/SkfB family radical SAM enzyme